MHGYPKVSVPCYGILLHWVYRIPYHSFMLPYRLNILVRRTLKSLLPALSICWMVPFVRPSVRSSVCPSIRQSIHLSNHPWREISIFENQRRYTRLTSCILTSLLDGLSVCWPDSLSFCLSSLREYQWKAWRIQESHLITSSCNHSINMRTHRWLIGLVFLIFPFQEVSFN